jgi:hypothetical protein
MLNKYKKCDFKIMALLSEIRKFNLKRKNICR